MTSLLRKKARRATVALSRAQVETIITDMGWEPEDAAIFWRLARRESRAPGCLDRANRAYWRRVMRADAKQN